MAEKSNSRITNLSTRYLSFYKHGVAIVILFLFSVLVYFQAAFRSKFTFFFSTIYYSYFLFLWWRLNRRVYCVEFDEEYLYVQQKNQDLLIPLENIKDVNLISIGGVYKVELYSPETFGDIFYFKPSLLYPFNHKKKEALVDILWANIEKAKKLNQALQRNALVS